MTHGGNGIDMPMTSGAESKSRTVWQAVGRPIASFMAACYSTAFVCILLSSPSKLLYGTTSELLDLIGFSLFASIFFMLLIAFIAFIPTMLAVGLLHLTRLPRGPAEAFAGLLIAPVLAILLSGSMGGSRYSILTLLSQIIPFAIAGFVGGATYWIVLGRPAEFRAQ